MSPNIALKSPAFQSRYILSNTMSIGLVLANHIVEFDLLVLNVQLKSLQNGIKYIVQYINAS